MATRKSGVNQQIEPRGRTDDSEDDLREEDSQDEADDVRWVRIDPTLLALPRCTVQNPRYVSSRRNTCN